MSTDRFAGNFVQFADANNICKKKVSDDERHHVKYQVLGSFFEDLFFSPRGFGKNLLSSSITFNGVFNFPEKHFHEYSLGADPTAKQATECRGEQNNEYNECDHCKSE